ncbi:monovalent cation/H(+) antiporter subunit G [Coraliomargarita sp. SDUM461004]|uniref:Monovalent cation/H(+) antiporter subunit G n=1 Tax=Thalassobacterium sedimentorum TaxID=3041258 RepID=A0ABU1AL72_9BACT|nr:monovalent cation/H(+) antiporter subunit G [Coraliomargarita sp. SDUM461004]MDQ8194590.1 monovalent cation/H(+) antiporter subunit G [Coraliomargarita sp. SDUM461004]
MSWLVALLLILGAFFAFVAALGVLRFPDFYARMHAATKAGAFGAALLLLAAAIHFGSLRAIITVGLIIVFFYLTTPVAAQTIAQAAYRRGVALWSKTVHDQLAEDEAE